MNGAMFLKTRKRRLVAVLGTIYIMFLGAVIGGCADRLLLHPSTGPMETDDVQRHTFTCNDKSVEIWSCQSKGVTEGQPPKAYVLCFLGNAARAEWVAPWHAEDWGHRPVEVWAVNYPGYGGSAGPARLRSIGPVALAAYDAVHAAAGQRPIFVEAESIGTAASLYVAANRPVAGCVLHNPPPLRELILGRGGWWNLWLIAGPVAMSIPRELDSLANAKSVTAPAVFMSADADEIVTPVYQQRVIDAYAGSKRVVHVPGAGHNDRATGEAEVQHQAGLDWLWHLANLQ